MLYFTKGYYTVALCRQTYNVAYTASYPTLMVTMMTPSSVLCTIKIWLWSCWRLCCMLLFVQFLKWVLFHGSVWKQLKECPLVFLADLSTHGCSLWYYSYLLWQVVGSETLGLPYLSSGWCHVQKTGIVQSQWAKVRRIQSRYLAPTIRGTRYLSTLHEFLCMCTHTTMTYLHCGPLISQCGTSICQSSVIPAREWFKQNSMIFIESRAN